MRFLLRIVVVIYGLCCIAALSWLMWRGSGWFGVSDPLAGVYAIALGMPWTLWLDRVPGNFFLVKVLAITVAMAINYSVASLLTRRRYRRW
ncbi:hypothetical protein [Xanthomonas sp. XNM01]|jgi:hypothetical protein|uniref:hypothetical protein n=1 Tax=Xanthomonas sp. XNM01 TaxID=2769289 RepID=UPI00177C2821|nr:hypothetical protein [Xanthomonas sp. XNM01]MBD9369739.1 hypothetical protein [Xanthomonas sp. XNM01]